MTAALQVLTTVGGDRAIERIEEEAQGNRIVAIQEDKLILEWTRNRLRRLCLPARTRIPTTTALPERNATRPTHERTLALPLDSTHAQRLT